MSLTYKARALRHARNGMLQLNHCHQHVNFDRQPFLTQIIQSLSRPWKLPNTFYSLMYSINPAAITSLIGRFFSKAAVHVYTVTLSGNLKGHNKLRSSFESHNVGSKHFATGRQKSGTVRQGFTKQVQKVGFMMKAFIFFGSLLAIAGAWKPAKYRALWISTYQQLATQDYRLARKFALTRPIDGLAITYGSISRNIRSFFVKKRVKPNITGGS